MLLANFVIGSTVESALFALVNNFFFVPTRKMPPLFYKTISPPIFGLNSESEIWTKINLNLGLLSKRISFEDASTIRIVDDKLKIATSNTTFSYHFNKLFIFDPTGIQTDNKIAHTKEKTFCVIDDFELSVLGPKKQSLDPIIREGGFVNQLHFYSSDRVDGSDYITDCVAESELTEKELNCFDYSDTMVRFVVERHLTSLGVHGNLMKLYNNGKPKYRKPKVVHVKRFCFEKDNNIYEDTEKVKFLNLKIGEIIEKSAKGKELSRYHSIDWLGKLF